MNIIYPIFNWRVDIRIIFHLKFFWLCENDRKYKNTQKIEKISSYLGDVFFLIS